MKSFLLRTWKPVFAAWMRFAHVLGIVNTTILLTLVYVVVVLPMRLIAIATRMDPLHLKDFRHGPAWRARMTEPDSLEERSHPF